MFAIFGIGQTELLIIGLIACVLALPLAIAAVVVAVLLMGRKE